MRYQASTSVEIPAHRFAAFKSAVNRYVRAEHPHTTVDYVSVILDASANGNSTVRVLVDSQGGDHDDADQGTLEAVTHALLTIGAPLDGVVVVVAELD